MVVNECKGCGGTVWATDSRADENICEPCSLDIELGNV